MDKLFVLVLMIAFLILMLFASSPRPEPELGGLPEMQTEVPDDPWYESEVLSSPVPVLVDFSAKWCGPCQLMKRELKEIHEKYGDRLKVVDLDVDEHPQLANFFNARSIPMLMLVVEGKIVGGGVGYADAEAISKLIDPHVSAPAAKGAQAVSAAVTGPGAG